MALIHLAILLPLIAAIAIGVIYRYYKRLHLGWFVLPVPLIIVIYLLTLVPRVSNNQLIYESLAVMPRIGMNFDVYIDGLGLLFAILISGIGALVVLYSIGYLSHREDLGSFYVYLLMFMSAMLGVVLNDNVLMLYLFWELTSISSFLLIAFWFMKERSLYGAQKSMLITMGGGFLMLGGFILLYIMTGTFSIREMLNQVSAIQESPLAPLAVVLILFGAFTKSAQFPFYIWLPDAMEAPTPVSAYLHSATMVKAGIYLVARLTPLFAFSELWVWIILLGGLITMAWASFNAIRKDDLKAVLAFSTVSQLGLIMSLLGLGALSVVTGANEEYFSIAVVAAVFHLINHATFKGALFMVTGIVDHEAGTRSLKKLGGLLTVMPVSFTLTLITALSMAGLPPFNGFLSKELFLEAMIHVGDANFSALADVAFIFPLLAIVGSIFTFIYSILLIYGVFFGKRTYDTPKEPHEAPALMLISPAILTVLVLVFGFFPNVLSGTIIDPAAMSIMASDTPLETHLYMWHGFANPALWATVFIVITGTLLFYFRDKWMFIYDYHKDRFTLNYLYDQGLIYSRFGSRKITDSYMSGFIRSYLVYIFLFFIVMGILTLLNTGIRISFDDMAPVGIHEMAVVLIILVSIVVILGTKSRMVSIIMLGAIGFSMSLFFVFFRAADLALTQLAIETVTTALFLVCFYHLPKNSRHQERMRFKLTNFLVSLGVALIVIIIGLTAYSNRLFDRISEFHIENVYELAAGGNMVNVILVDFRGFDTLFETLVFGIAGIGIYSLMKLRLNRKDGNNEEHAEESRI
ncbi:Na+/H+ antiporter subunit A [Salinicoccus roseus]|uniref:Na+/H+ antiporter subunit A n=1 Tax=Salinicoccus roseus TaxID=45670 RepID=UPI000F4F3B92|nr:Na+/H+ antiporter subunit A [Salinicoccus roseus]RPE54936.1 multisubunit sodium/proton antiporter MrpA subunit [Salinicoccus roseus]GGA61472.1 Na(+)/H(+) antiporter subunit A1 [Salinicoccus roseus]